MWGQIVVVVVVVFPQGVQVFTGIEALTRREQRGDTAGRVKVIFDCYEKCE